MASPRIVPTGILGGIAGKDGSNVLPTDTAIKNAIQNPASQTAVALSASQDAAIKAQAVLKQPATRYRRTRVGLAKALAKTGVCKVAVVGDSTAFGWTGGTGTRNGAGVNVAGDESTSVFLAQMLKARGYPLRGTGPVGCWHGNLWDKRWSWPTANPGWGNLNSASPLIYTYAGTPSGPAVLDTTTTGETGTIVDVYYANSGGTFTISVDGGAPATVNTNGTSSMSVFTITGLANTTHSVAITGSNAQLFGAGLRSTSYGVDIWNLGMGGAFTSQVLATNWFESLALVLTQWNADLVIVGPTGVNDAGNPGVTGASTAAQYLALLQAGFAAIGADATDMIAISPVPANGLDISAYTAAMHTASAGNGNPLIDVTEQFGGYSTANGLGLMYDNLHLLPPGNAALAAYIDRELFAPINSAS